MKQAVRPANYVAMSCIIMAGGALIAGSMGACSSDDNSNPPIGADSGSMSSTDSGTGADSTVTTVVDSGNSDTGVTSQPGDDAGTPDAGQQDAAPSGDASDGGSPVDAADSAVAPSFCQTQQGLDFCDDFDLPGSLSLDGGSGTAWTSLVGSTTELVISSAQAQSQPDSLLVQLPEGPADGGAGTGDQSAKVVKMITPASGVSQAIYEFDVYIANVPLASVGGFATDFQFDDTSAGTDQFGFRIGVFANATGFDHADLEHNHPVLGGNDDIVSPISITYQAWNHVKMVVAYAAESDGGDNVAFQLYLNNGATAAVDATWPAPFAVAPFARFAAGMVYAFDSTNKDWEIYYDNFTLKLQ
jgi:hypothetical protein